MPDTQPTLGRESVAMGAPPALILDFLEWLSPAPRSYAEVMERWRTACPRLTVWEDAVDSGYVARRRPASGPAMVDLTARGRAALASGRARP